MKSYTSQDMTAALAASGLVEGDVVYLSTRLFGLGRMTDVANRDDFLSKVWDCIWSVIGPGGTLVVPTFTQQVGQFGVEYVHEETPSRTGMFGEYVRLRDDSVRSLHPVFSVSAVGRRAKDICEDISPVAFGVDSAFERIVRFGGKAVCMGFERETGHIVSLMHLVETGFSVPYYYTKRIDAAVRKDGQLINHPFFINVKYLNYDIRFDYMRYIEALEDAGLVGAAPLGESAVFTCGAREQFDLGIRLLKQDVYAFLKAPPSFRDGEIPCDGPPQKQADAETVKNWMGFDLREA